MKDARATMLLAWTIALSLTCGGVDGPQGPRGFQGDPGPMGAMGTPGEDGQDLTATFPDCPIGYVRDQTSTNYIVCKQGSDEVVKVGSKGSAFWIGRYEASTFRDENGVTGANSNSPEGYPVLPNGQWPLGQTEPPLYALSTPGNVPARYITWFQAQAACNASGKRLPTRNEWLEAARGTIDPGEHSGDNGSCVTLATGPRTTAVGRERCVSHWGAQDMIGNLWEWTDEWYAGLGQGDVSHQPWPAMGYQGDGTYNIASSATRDRGGGGPVTGIPAAALRGGDRERGARSGLFSLFLSGAPSYSDQSFGFRCVVPR